MHLLAAKPGAIVDGTEAVDLGQSPGDIVVLSAADTETGGAGPGAPAARRRLSAAPSRQPDAARAPHVGRRLCRGRGGGGPAVARPAARRCRLLALWGGAGRPGLPDAGASPLAVVPGDDKPDPELASWSTLGAEARDRLWQYAVHGGPENARNLLAYAADLIGGERLLGLGRTGTAGQGGALLAGARPACPGRPARAVDRRCAGCRHRVLPRAGPGWGDGAGRCPGRGDGGGGAEPAAGLRRQPEGPGRGRHAARPVRGGAARRDRQRHPVSRCPAPARRSGRRRSTTPTARCSRRSSPEEPRRTGAPAPEGSPPATSP